MKDTGYCSWGRVCARDQQVRPLHWRPGALAPEGRPLLGRGLGRSYGDVCLNDGGVLLDCAGLDRFLDYDPDSGRLRVEAGVSLEAVLARVLRDGWFLPVTPGTRHVTVAGAVANDVHGKNHHRAGTFGRHVRAVGLLRSDRGALTCSAEDNPDLFRATVGGLGLTGLITWVELQLKAVPGPAVEVEAVPFASLDEFLSLSRESDGRWEYTVAWIDALGRGPRSGRGVFFRGNHVEGEAPAPRAGTRLAVPPGTPGWLLGPAVVRLFNAVYFRRQSRRGRQRVDYRPFFYPLDGIRHWNRLYGRRGFFQFQCVVPEDAAVTVLGDILQRAARAGQGSFLSVLKVFGDVPSPGLLSFPRPGVTLALDFPNRGERTRALLRDFEERVREAGGALYPAKDALMSPRSFRAFFPRWAELAEQADPAFSSSFWRRVTEAAA